MDLKGFTIDTSIFPPEKELFIGEPITPEWFSSLQKIFTDDSYAARYYECYLQNIERAHSQMLALTLLYQVYLLSQSVEEHPYSVVGSPIVYVVYDNYQRQTKNRDSEATIVWYDLLKFSFASPYFSNLGVSLRGNRISFNKDERFCILKAKSTGDILGQNIAGGLLFLEDVLSEHGRLDQFEFPELHKGLTRRIQSRFMSQKKRFPGTLFIAVPSNIEDYEHYKQKIKDIQMSDIEPNTTIVLDDRPKILVENNDTQEKSA